MPHATLSLKDELMRNPLKAGRILFARVDEPQGDEDEFDAILEPETPPGCPAPGPRPRGLGVEVSARFLKKLQDDYGRPGAFNRVPVLGAIGQGAQIRRWLAAVEAGALAQAQAQGDDQ
jgi:hypothetical protein